MQKIKIHSMTDLITNSSTTIYTHSEDSPAALEALVNEFFNSVGMTLKCGDVFNFKVEKNQDQYYDMLIDSLDEDDKRIPKKFKGDYTKAETAFVNLIADIDSGKIKAPAWFKELDEQVNESMEDNGIDGDSILVITAKDPKFEKLAQLLVNFLYSTEAEEGAE